VMVDLYWEQKPANSKQEFEQRYCSSSHLPKRLINPGSSIAKRIISLNISTARIPRRKAKALPRKLVVYKAIPPTNSIANITLAIYNLCLVLNIECGAEIYAVVQTRSWSVNRVVAVYGVEEGKVANFAE